LHTPALRLTWRKGNSSTKENVKSCRLTLITRSRTVHGTTDPGDKKIPSIRNGHDRDPTKSPASQNPEVSSAACNTSVTTAGPPVWSSGSGAIKEIRLHTAEMRVKTLEKENVKLKEHEEFYINKAREWKSRALKYERTMEQHGVVVPGKENKKDTADEASKSASDTAAQSVPIPDPETAKVYQVSSSGPFAENKSQSLTRPLEPEGRVRTSSSDSNRVY